MKPEILSGEDRAAIEAAVREAERRTGCEVVVTVVRACDTYQHAGWKAATCGALAGALVTAATTRGLEIWGLGWLWLLLPAPVGALLGWIVAQSSVLRRTLATPETLRRRVASRAARAFLDAEVFRTAARTGVLIFLAQFERQVVVLADSGIRARVPDDVLAKVARGVTARLRAAPGATKAEMGRALLEGVERCAATLAEHGFAKAGARGNELADSVRVEE